MQWQHLHYFVDANRVKVNHFSLISTPTSSFSKQHFSNSNYFALILKSIQQQLSILEPMPNTIANFQRQLLEKIHQKSKSKESIDSFLSKSFKFFDLHHNGYLSKSDFFKSIAKCGVVVQPSSIEAIYQHYAGDDEKIDYHQFIEEIATREEEIDSNSSRLKFSQKSQVFQEDNRSMAMSKKQQQQKSILKESKASKPIVKLQNYDQVLNYIKESIQIEGLGSLISLAVKFKSTDTSKTHLVNKNTLSKFLDFLSKDHINLILNQLSQNGNQIDYSVFVYDLKGQLDEQTVKEIDSTFYYLDSRREGEFPIDYLLSRYLSKSLEQKFRRAVDLYARFQGIDDGIFTEDDFNDFFGFLSFDFPSIQDFKKNLIRPFYEEDNKSSISQKSNRTRDFQLHKSQKDSMVGGDFRKEKKETQVVEDHDHDDHFNKFKEELEDEQDKKSVSRYSQFQGHEMPNNKLKIFESVILRIKKRLASKGTRGFLQLQKALKNADTDHDTLLTVQQFNQVIKDQRIDITSTESNSIYDLFDNEGAGLISFAEFMFTLRGHMSEMRKDLAEKLWSQIRNNDETTSFSKIRHLLNFRSHPDVQTGRRYQDDIWKQIQETILTVQELNGVPRSDVISKAEFEEYLENLSLSVIDDKLFESILLNFWRLDTSSSILEKYAGSRKLFDHSKNGYLMDHHRNYVKGGSVSQNAPFGTFHEATSYTTEHHRL